MKNYLCITTLVLLLGACSSNGDSDTSDGGADGKVDGTTTTTPLDREEVARACVVASACGITSYPSIHSCIQGFQTVLVSQRLTGIYNKIYQCVNKTKGDCDAVATCYQRGPACDSSYKAKCEGKVAVFCDLQDKRIYKINCADAKMDCAVKKGYAFAAVCTPGTCYSTFGDSCKGDLHYTCISGVIEVKDCAATGKQCGKVQKGVACLGNQQASCSEYFAPDCKKSVAMQCVNGYEHHVDCAKNKLAATACKDGECISAGTACSSGAVNRCSGTQLEACLDGAWKKYDCAALGLGDCKSTGTSAQCGKR